MEAPSHSGLRARAGQAAWWALPPAFCLALYWYGLNAWFRDDDFLWLGLRFRVHTWSDLCAALFSPAAHGTFRPLSERAYFLALGSLFPLDALPFRAWAFLTQFASLALLASITRRLTGSRLAGLLAAMFWAANSNLSVAMSWSSAYMQILCGFWLLLAFHLLLRHLETGRWRYYWLQWGAFLAGFLAMESTLVYPALASAYTLACARRHWRRTLPLWAASWAFAIFHMKIAPKQAAGPYALHFDGRMLETLWTYWRWAFEPRNLAALTGYPEWVAPAGTVLFSLALVGFTVWRVRKGDWLPLVLLGWFVTLLAPVLPLREHVSAYYLTLPAFALAMLGGYAAAAAWRAGRAWRSVAAAVAACYLLISAPGAWGAVRWNYNRSRDAQTLVFGVVKARQLHPRQAILLTRVSDRLFWTAVWDGGFEAAGISGVYLDEASRAHIAPRPGRGDISGFLLPDEVAAQGLARNEIVVYETGGPRLRNVTRLYAARLETPPGLPPRRVDVANPLMSYVLGAGWHPLAGNHRWIPQRATLRLGGPRTAAERLYVSGYCPASLLRAGPLEMTVGADGAPLSTVTVTRGDARFQFNFGLPDRLAGRPEVEIEVQVSRTQRSAERELGLVFGVFEIR